MGDDVNVRISLLPAPAELRHCAHALGVNVRRLPRRLAKTVCAGPHGSCESDTARGSLWSGKLYGPLTCYVRL